MRGSISGPACQAPPAIAEHLHAGAAQITKAAITLDQLPPPQPAPCPGILATIGGRIFRGDHGAGARAPGGAQRATGADQAGHAPRSSCLQALEACGGGHGGRPGLLQLLLVLLRQG